MADLFSPIIISSGNSPQTNCITTGLNDYPKHQLSVYHNQGDIILHPQNFSGNWKLEIFNVIGETIISQQLVLNELENRKIRFSKRGIFILSLSQDNYRLSKKLLVY